MFSPTLSRKIFVSIFCIVVAYSVAVYFFSVPLIKATIYGAEERAAKTILDNVYNLVKSEYLAIEAYRESALEAYKRQLKNITLIQESFLKSKYQKFKDGLVSEEEARRSALNEMRTFRYGNNDYLWVANYDSVLISHPDPKLHNADFSDVRDIHGNLIVPPMVQVAREKDEGYTSYWWRRLGEKQAKEKLTYSRNFPEWEWVIGTGVYVDDVAAEVARRKRKMIQELRRMLRQVKIARTGYMYIFDSNLDMIIHPNSNIENTNFSNLLNPVTQKPIGRELIEAARKPEPKFEYKWDKPDDKNRYIYDKISWVKYFKGFDWYLASSVYMEELNSGAVMLRNRLLGASLLMLVLTLAIGFGFLNRILIPVRHLSDAARKVKDGDLSVRCDVHGRDEIGILAGAFNEMVIRLRENIASLDDKVRERTLEIEWKNEALENEIAERERIEEELKKAKEYLENVLENSPDAIGIVDGQGRFIHWNRMAQAVYGYSLEELKGKSSAELYADPDELKRILEKLRSHGAVRRFESRMKTKDGNVLPFEISIGLLKDENGQNIGSVCVARNLSDMKKALTQLTRTNEQLNQVIYEISQLNAMGDMIQVCQTVQETYAIIASYAKRLFPDDSGMLCVFNNSRTLLETGVAWGNDISQDTVFSQNDCWALRQGKIHTVLDPEDGVLCRHVESKPPAGYLCIPMIAQGQVTGLFHVRLGPSVLERHREDAKRLVESKQRLAMTVAEHIGLALANLSLRESLRRQSIRDPLTGLFNRRYMEESLERETHRARRRGNPLGIVMLDIDHFKRFNDTHGHDAGDHLLAELGALLQAHVRKEDIACRYGGEEFTLILPECGPDELLQRAEQLRSSVKNLTVRHLNQPLDPVTISIGLACFPRNGSSPEAILKIADNALYEAKTGGRDRVVFACS